MADNPTQAWVLTLLTPHLEGKMQRGTFETALNQALQIEDELSRANTLSHLGPHIIGRDLDRVLVAVEAIKVKQYHARVLAALVPNATEAQQERIFAAAMQLADGWGAVLPSFPRLPDAVLADLQRAELEGEAWYRAYVLRALVPHSVGELRERAIEAILALKDGEALADSFADVSDFLEGERLERALRKAKGILADEFRAKALASLANRFTEPRRSALISEARAAAAKVEDPQDRTQALVTIGRACEGQEQAEVFAEALDTIVEIGHEEIRYDEFGPLVPDLPDGLLEKAKKVASTFGKGAWGNGARKALAERLNR